MAFRSTSSTSSRPCVMRSARSLAIPFAKVEQRDLSTRATRTPSFELVTDGSRTSTTATSSQALPPLLTLPVKRPQAVHLDRALPLHRTRRPLLLLVRLGTPLGAPA